MIYWTFCVVVEHPAARAAEQRVNQEAPPVESELPVFRMRSLTVLALGWLSVQEYAYVFLFPILYTKLTFLII